MRWLAAEGVASRAIAAAVQERHGDRGVARHCPGCAGETVERGLDPRYPCHSNRPGMWLSSRYRSC
jgi:hypothetical protein